MKLNQLERESACWVRVSAELTERLTMLREQNDKDLSVEETIKLRGRIAEIKLILTWAEPDPHIT